MSRLVITHLAFGGEDTIPVSVRFGQHLNIMHGPSDTGKSAVVNAIDFVLGASKLDPFPELEPYSAVLLGLQLTDGRAVTLVRKKTGKVVDLYDGSFLTLPQVEPTSTLEAKHDSSDESNISRFLLRQIGLDDKKVRKNKSNNTNTLSFRDIARVCIVTETAMQAEHVAGTTGQFVNKTKELSVLRLLLSGKDDSALVAGADADANRLKRARLQVLEKLKHELEDQFDSTELGLDIYTVRDDLNIRIEQVTAGIGEKLNAREELLDKRTNVDKNSRLLESKRSESVALHGRLNLLLRQYESDLYRLESIEETGNLLGLLNPGICIVCGADPSEQHSRVDCNEDDDSFSLAVSAELIKTRGLMHDLSETLQNIHTHVQSLDREIQKDLQEKSDIDEKINVLEISLLPFNEKLDQLLKKRGELDRLVGLFEHLQLVEAMIAEEKDEVPSDHIESHPVLEAHVAEEFSKKLRDRLRAWGYPEADSVVYDPEEMEILATNQKRSTHGKGVRALLHAAFTISLAQYCFDHGLPHPGFVVLDSPLITYRPPDRSEDDAEYPPAEVVGAFFRDIELNFTGQILIVENVSPEHPLNSSTVEIAFTKAVGSGRYGLFPH